MSRIFAALVFAASMTLWAVAPLWADEPSQTAQELYDRIRPSLVAVQYTLNTELGRRELIFAGTIVSADGLVMIPMAPVGESVPDEQMKEFKVIVPRDDGDPMELDAIFQGRDDRNDVAFVKTKEPQKWTPIHFENAKLEVGQTVLSVGLLPKAAGYR